MAAGVGTISIFENVNGQRGPQLFTKRIPLTPGPLVVTIKVASDQDPANASKFWPPNEDDQVEIIAASCAYGLRRALTTYITTTFVRTCLLCADVCPSSPVGAKYAFRLS